VTTGPGTLFEELDASRRRACHGSVSRLNQRVREIYRPPGTLWLTGEIAGFNKAAHKRIASFHLVEREGEGRLRGERSPQRGHAACWR
jgi:hypothetical protein